MKNFHSNFLLTEDKEQIFYSTNFKPGTQTKDIIVFNYGLVCSNYHWEKQIKFFDDLGFPILIHDYRGHYQSSGIQDIEKITFARIAEDLKQILDYIKIKTTIMIGHSMGVNVTLEFAKRYPSYVSKSVLISGTIFPVYNIMLDSYITGPMKPFIRKTFDFFPKEFKLFWKYGGWTPPIKFGIKQGGFNPKQVSDEFIETYLNKLGELGPELFFHLLEQMHTHDSLAFMNQIHSKTLVIGGNRDKVIPNFLQRLMHDSLKDSELYLIHTGSHVPQVDFPQVTNERIELFISGSSLN